MITQYTGKQRVMAALKRQFADRVPVSIPLSPYSAKLAGLNINEFYGQAQKRVKAIATACETFGPDTVGVGSDPPSVAEAIGSELESSEEITLGVAKRVFEDKSALAKMQVPDPNRSPLFLNYLEACQSLSSELKDISVGGLFAGPWTLGMMARGTETLIYDTIDDPGFVHELMRFTTELIKVYGMAIRQTGVGLTIGDPSAGCSLISPSIYRSFVKPYHQELVDYFKNRKIWISLHICGYIDPIMDDIVSLGVGSISLDGPSSLKKLVEVSQKKVTIIGNVPTELFVEGTKDQMENAVKSCLEIAAKDSGYILCSGCAIPFDSPVEKVKWFMDSAHKYGRYNQM